MEQLAAYRALADQLGRREFVGRFGHPFLLKPPRMGATTEPIAFRTAEAPERALYALLRDDGVFASEWRVAPVCKRPGNPFPDRISVGRATNCDVVLRLSYVSKLHASFIVTASGLELEDHGSVNGTRVNGRPLDPQSPVAVAPGDRLSFGALDVDLVDPPTFYSMLIVKDADP